MERVPQVDAKNSIDPRHISRRDFTRLATGLSAGLALCPAIPLFAEEQTDPPLTGQDLGGLDQFSQMMTSFLQEHSVPGGALAVAHLGRLVYARGFGWAEVENQVPVSPTALFRIASLSKPITAVAVHHLAESGRIGLDDPVFDKLNVEPFLATDEDSFDERIKTITIRQCLQHTGGFDRSQSSDPLFIATRISEALDIPLPLSRADIIRYVLGRPLDFDPGTKYAYSNFGFLLLSQMLEQVTGDTYEHYVQQNIFAPLGITRMRLAKAMPEDRAEGEVHYYATNKGTGKAIRGGKLGTEVPIPYGVLDVENFDAAGGWLGSVVDLVRFGSALDHPAQCPLLSEKTIHQMLSPPTGEVGYEAEGKPKSRFYSCGWSTRPEPGKPTGYTKWHNGLISGVSTILVCRSDGYTAAAMFNMDRTADDKSLAVTLDPKLHPPADQMNGTWPEGDLFPEYLGKK